MSPEFDVKWLSLSVDGTDGLDEVVAAERRAAEPAPTDGRFEALLASHLGWATRAQSGEAKTATVEIPVDVARASRIARQVSEQLARIAQEGVTA